MILPIIKLVAYKYVRGVSFYVGTGITMELCINKLYTQKRNKLETNDFYDCFVTCFAISSAWPITIPLMCIMGSANTRIEVMYRNALFVSWFFLILF